MRIFPEIITSACFTFFIYDSIITKKIIRVIDRYLKTKTIFGDMICKGNYKNGKPCKYKCYNGAEYCRLHSESNSLIIDNIDATK